MKSRHDYIGLWICLVSKELKAKYKRTFFGYAWSILMPLLQSLIFYCVFSVFLRFAIEDYFLYLFIGCMVWQFFSNSLMLGVNSMLSNANLVRKTTAPRWIFVLSSVSAEAVHLLLSFPVVLVLMLWCGRTLTWSALWMLPLCLISIISLTYGLALAAAAVNAYFRDLERIIHILLQAWFYATPIFYAVFQVPKRYHWLIHLNVVYYPVALCRTVFYGPEADLFCSLIAVASGLFFLACGIVFFHVMQKKFAEVL